MSTPTVRTRVVEPADVKGFRLDAHPVRTCNGGPNGSAFCGKVATHVAGVKMGTRYFEWFCCGAELGHHEGAGEKPDTRLVPFADWYDACATIWLAEDAEKMLRRMFDDDEDQETP